ncbi:MAG: hypothetical protein K2F73_02530 [Ruminococcus sp.]|nr:hypothetical protein [Ruminococcus sp.]
MGAYAVPSNQPFIAKGELKTKRKPGRLEECTKFFEGTKICLDNTTGKFVVIRGEEVVGVFKEEDEEDVE